jgi:hypothetical protein
MAGEPKKPTTDAGQSKNWGPEVPGTEQVKPGLYVAKETKSIFVAFAATPKAPRKPNP